jgi:hypothetical protein
MSDFEIVDGKLEINVNLSYFDKTEYITTYRKVLYDVGDEISIEGEKVFLHNITKFRKKIAKSLGTDTYTYQQCYLRIGVNKGMFHNYRLDYSRELRDVYLNFDDDSVRNQWTRIQKIKKVLDA